MSKKRNLAESESGSSSSNDGEEVLSDISEDETMNDEISELFVDNDYSASVIKKDHILRPIYITDNNTVIMESFSPA